MERMIYEVSADLLTTKIIFGIVMLFCIALLITTFLYLKTTDKEINRAEYVKMQILNIFVGVIFMIVLCVALLEWSNYKKVILGYENNKYSIAEGSVENFLTSGRYESFEISGVKFRYSNHNLGYGYRTTKGEGGVVAGNGQKLRVYYIYSNRFSRNEIVRIDSIE